MNNSYPSYNSVEFGWVSEIPSHWEVARTKDLFSLEKRPVRETDGVVTAFRDGQVTLRSNRRTDGFTNAISEIGYQGVRAGDLVIHNMDAFAGAIGISDSDGKSTPVYSVCSPKNETHAPYFSALIRHIAISGYIQSLSRGIRERSSDFRWADSGCLSLPAPPRDEQIAIAAFLDHETGRIDSLIAEQERLIALLDEKRHAVISHAVTKGLDPDVEMKDSGIEWLGEVPAHWTVVRLKQAAECFPSNVDKHSVDGEQKVLLCNYTDVYKNDIISGSLSFMTATATDGQVSRYSLLAGDVIITKDSETADDIARPAYVPDALPGVVCGYHLSMVRANERASGRFIARYFDTISARSYFRVNVNGLTRVGLGQYALDNAPLALPPVNEQLEIADHLDRQLVIMDGLKSDMRKSAALLKERRSALISAAVTGKIDVRNHPAAVAALNENKG